MNDKRTLNTLLGILLPNIVSLIIIGISKYIVDTIHQGINEDVMRGQYTGNYDDHASIFIFSDFIIVPLLMGLISAYCWRSLEFRAIRYVGLSALNTGVAVMCSAIFLHEGYICLIIVCPLIFGMIVAGALLGKVIFKRRNNTLNSSVFGLLILVLVADIFTPHAYTNMVSDTVIIQAPIDKVWPYVVEYEPIKEKEDYWLFQVGMPSPVQSTVDGHCAGAGRKCIFSNGYTFDEKMTVYEPNKDLTFDIITQPRDPEIMGHIDILRGQFILKDNGDGTTTLIGNSWYSLHVFPVWYFDAWARSITRNVHLRVMQHVKKLSEHV